MTAAGWRVEIDPSLEEEVAADAGSKGAARERSKHFLHAMRKLRASGTFTKGVTKLNDLELYEIRCGDDRVFFVPVKGMRKVLAIASRVTKKSKTLKQSVYRKHERLARDRADKVRRMS